VNEVRSCDLGGIEPCAVERVLDREHVEKVHLTHAIAADRSFCGGFRRWNYFGDQERESSSASLGIRLYPL
jgi:hypothetical protein